MRDRKGWPRRSNRRLRGDAAGPEYRQLAGLDRHRIAIVGLGEILDPDFAGKAEMHRRAVHRRKPRGDLNGANGIVRLQWPHRYDHRAVESSRRLRGNIRAVHRDIGTALDVANGNTAL